MTPEQIKKHEPMNINNFYEAVPVTNANIPEPGSRLHVLTKDGQKAVYIFTGSDMSVITMKEQYSHYLRPVTRESIEAFLREFGEKMADYIKNDSEVLIPMDRLFNPDGSNITKKEYGKVVLEILADELKQTAITELINKTLGQ